MVCWLERRGLDLRLMPGDRVCGAVAQTGHSPIYARPDGTRGVRRDLCCLCLTLAHTVPRGLRR